MDARFTCFPIRVAIVLFMTRIPCCGRLRRPGTPTENHKVLLLRTLGDTEDNGLSEVKQPRRHQLSRGARWHWQAWGVVVRHRTNTPLAQRGGESYFCSNCSFNVCQHVSRSGHVRQDGDGSGWTQHPSHPHWHWKGKLAIIIITNDFFFFNKMPFFFFF